MVDTAAVRVSLPRDKVQPGDLGEGSLVVGVGDVDAGSLGHLVLVLGPGDVDGSRIETRHQTDQRVGLRQLDFISGVDHRTGGSH